ncbi:ash family protein [Escherichia coli]|nr:ash family protein [Escherichia coli]HAW7896824.1 ash family protein [Escherichia coli]HCO3851832.1 ash family protein [Escherichia coli]
MKKNLLVCLLHSNRHKQPPLLINAAIPRRIPFLRRDYTYFSTQHKNRLPALVVSGYISAAPHKTGAGFRSLPTSKAHNRASGFFVRTVLPRLFRVRIMAGRTGPTSVGPGSLLAGTANLVRLATHSFAALDGEFSQLTSKEATPWQTASNSAPALSVFTSAAKSTADSIGLHLSPLSCSQTYYTDLTTVSLPGITRQSSAISPKIWQNYKASSTSTDKPHPEAIPHPCAGGFRTSVTGGSHEER